MAAENPLSSGEASAYPQTEGFAPFEYPSFSPERGDPSVKTWYRIYGELKPGVSRPLILLHGGPGVATPVLAPAMENVILPALQPDHPIVMYDQIGCGRSTHLPNRKGDKEFWVPELFVAELDNLVKHLGVRDQDSGFDLLGHSWGAQVSSRYAVFASTSTPEHAPRLNKVILSSPTCRWKDFWRTRDEGLKQLPQKMQDDVHRGIAEGNVHSPEYMAALLEYLHLFLARNAPGPWQERINAIAYGLRDNIVYQVILGTDPLNPIGTMNGKKPTSSTATCLWTSAMTDCTAYYSVW
jgi:proline-specific peptidase